MSLINPFKIFQKEHLMHYYDSLSPTDRKLAWKSFMTWKDLPLGDGTADMYLHRRIILPLVKSVYFCPISDKDLIIKMLKPVAKRGKDECFVMLRPSQNQRPLVWVCALGGSERIILVRIGIPTPTNPNYTVILNNQLVYQDTDIHFIVTHLWTHYAKGRKIHPWINCCAQYTIGTDTSASSSPPQDQTMILV